jgi:carbamoyl-phosphate synthase small subunit
MIAKLALEDGTVFTGHGVGATGTLTGEVVFNTAMTGYQEVFTDPSYCGQIVTMTFPLQGNYGVNPDDLESGGTHLSGVVLRELPCRPSNYRAGGGLPEFLAGHGIIGLVGVDTRALTRRIRVHGALRGAISTELDDVQLVELARGSAPMTGANLVREVAPNEAAEWTQHLWRFAGDERPAAIARCHVVVVDCGIKHNILRHLVEVGCRVTTVPAGASAAEIRELKPDGLVVGNGPGDPAAVSDTIETLRALRGRYPMFGICLGHQLLSLALGARTYKLRFGHHGANLPVLNRETGRVEITSQNHGFAVDAASLERVGGRVTHVNLNDGTVEGFAQHDLGIMTVQYHPEASPGPHDAAYLFGQFVDAVVGPARQPESVIMQRSARLSSIAGRSPRSPVSHSQHAAREPSRSLAGDSAIEPT